MCLENNLNELSKEEHLKEIMGAVKIIKDVIPDIKSINVMLLNHSTAIDREIEDRKNDVNEVKHNYIKRFDKVDKVLDIIFKKIDDTNKMILGLFIFLLTSFMGVTVFLILNKIWGWL